MSRGLILVLVAGWCLPVQAQEGPLHPVRWLSGCWEARSADRVMLEMWMPAEGDLMLGVNRTLVGGKARATEQLRLAWRDGALVYTALPSGQATTEFTATEVTDSSFIVENPDHDFPKKISYVRRGADSLLATIEGPGPNGTRRIGFPMGRVPCSGAEPDRQD